MVFTALPVKGYDAAGTTRESCGGCGTERNMKEYENEKKYDRGERARIYLRKLVSIHEDAASNEEIKERIVAGGRITGTNMVIMMCAILIASVGLNTNSVAIIIGAMLISPLMGTILAMAYDTASNDHHLLRRHVIGFSIQIIISTIVATVYFLVSPAKGVTEQLLARTDPKFYDVVVAAAGGIAGIIGQTRKDKANNIIPGVAIATAIMPPLCTCGYAIANGNGHMLFGAAYLFAINAYFIYVSATIVLDMLGTPHVRTMTEKEWKKKRRKMHRNTVIVLIPMIALAVSLYFT